MGASCAVTLLHPSINVNSKTFASTYASTYKLYRKGQFKKSLTYGSKALKRAKSRAEKAKILKVMGISSYMLGKKKLSMTYFRLALKQNPRINVSTKEVLDPGIVGFFRKIKSPKRPKTLAKRKRPRKVVSKRTNSRRTKTNQTSINLKTPTRGSVLINGIFAGTTNQNLEVSPGVLKVTIQAKGYKPKSVKVRAIKNKASNYKINLARKIPKRPKRPMIAKQKTKKRRYPKISKKIKPRVQKDDMFAEEESEPMITGRDLKSELQMESGPVGFSQPAYSGYSPTPQPYQQYPSYPQYSAPMPPPTYSYAPAPAYVPPAQYPPTPVPIAPDPMASSPSIDYYSDNPQAMASGPTYSQSYSQTAPGPKFQATHLLPFGLGQFVQGDPIFGTLFGLAQAGCLGMAYYAWNQQNEIADTFIEVNKQNEVDAQFDQDALDKFKKESEASIAENETYTYLAIGGFGGLWLIGSIHAYMTAPPPAVMKSRPRRSRSIYGSKPDDAEKYKLTQTLLPEMVTKSTTESFQISPGLSLELKPMLSASYNF